MLELPKMMTATDLAKVFEGACIVLKDCGTALTDLTKQAATSIRLGAGKLNEAITDTLQVMYANTSRFADILPDEVKLTLWPNSLRRQSTAPSMG